MGKLTRNPSVNWRVETHREERTKEILLDPDREAEDAEAGTVGTVTLLNDGVMHQLNLMGGEIWKLCDGRFDRKGMLDSLLEIFDADRDTVAEDLDQFLSDMIQRELIHERD